MERCGSIILLGVLLPLYVCGIPFSLHKDGSETTRVCNCDSVDFWLPRRRDSSLELPSYEELTPSLEKSLNLDKKAGKYLRLRLQRDCKHTWLNKDEASTLNGDVSFKSESREDGSIEVWLKDGLRCMSFWMKCHESQRLICVGIDVLAEDFSQSIKRKLLMVVPDDKEEKISYGHYGIIMSAFVLCLMVILVALCGSRSTNSSVVYTGENSVEIISSVKVQSIHRKDISIENEEKEETDAKNVGHPEGVRPDRSSTSDSKTVVDHDKVSVAITDNGAQKDASDTTDDQVFVKEKDDERRSKNKKENSSEKTEKIKKEKDSLKNKEKGSKKEKNKKEKGSKKGDRNKKEEEGEKGKPEGVRPDRSSTSDSKTVVDHDKVSVAITDNGAQKDASDTTDDQVFVKEKDYEKRSKNRKENSSEKTEKIKKEKDSLKEKNKENGSKKEKNKKEKGSEKEKNRKEKGSKKEDRNKKEEEGEKGKEVRRCRAHTPPPETAEPKGFAKLRLSLKGNASATVEDRKSAKKGKAKSPSEFSPSRSPSTSDRRSLVHRELPQRPSQGSTEGVPATDDNYAEPFDCKVRPEVVANEIDDEDEDEDCNYETVTNQMTSRAMVSARNEVLKSCRNSASRRQVSAKESEDDNIFYDAVDEKKERKGTGECSNVQEKTLDISDTYEVVEESTKRTRSEPKPEANSQDLYEIVDSRNTLDVYEEPKIGRKRSASDIVTGSSSTMTEASHKSMSLDRGRSTAPPLPPLRCNKGHASAESEAELIDPYTLTTKKGDFIIQETSTSIIPNSMKANARAQPPVSPDEPEPMYTKVDKEKQKIDRLKVKRESNVELDECKKEEDDGAAMGMNAAFGAIANTVIAALVNDNHEYESISTLKRKPGTLIEGEDLYDEVVDNNAVPSNTTS